MKVEDPAFSVILSAVEFVIHVVDWDSVYYKNDLFFVSYELCISTLISCIEIIMNNCTENAT